MKQQNYGTLVWFRDTKFQHRNKWYEYDHYQPVTTYTNQLPPFQVPMDSAQTAIISFQLVNVEDNQFIQIRNEMEAAGLRTESYAATDDYPAHKLVIWPSTAKIPGTYKQGVYYAIMKTATQTWYSEHFVMRDYIGDDFIYLEWVHGEKYGLYPQVGHFIDYSKNYKNFLWIKCDIGKPQYFYEEEYDDRDVFPYPIHQGKYKLNQFSIIVSEYYLDILSEIPLHDCVRIIHQDHTYEVDQFIMNQPNWFDQGAKAEVVLQFRYNTVTIVSGRGVIDANCATDTEVPCFEAAFNAVSTIDFESDERTGYYYTNSSGVQVPFNDQDLVFIRGTNGKIILYRFMADGPFYQAVNPTTGQIAYDLDNKIYYQATGVNNEWVTFGITSYSGTMIQGTGIDGTTIEIIGRAGSKTESIAVITIEEFRAGYTFNVPGLDALQIIAANSLCGEIYKSDFWAIDPTPETPDTPEPGNPILPELYSDQNDAELNGATPDDIWLQDPNNSTQGLPGCIFRVILDEDGENPNFPVFDTIEDSLELGPNEVWVLGESNPYGMPAGVLCINPKGPVVYETEAEAAAAGVATGEPYLLSGKQFGFGHGAFIAVMNCEL